MKKRSGDDSRLVDVGEMLTQKPPLGTPLDWENPLNKDLKLHLATNEGHGDVVRDLSMNRNHGTLNSFAFPPTAVSGWNPGQTGIGLKFDGTNDYVNCGNDAILGDGSGAFTASLLVNFAASKPLLGNMTDNINGWGLELRSDQISFGVRKAAPVNYWLGHGSTTLSAGNWYSLVCVYNCDGSYPDLYVNGVAETVVKQLGAGADEGLSGFTTDGNNTCVGGGLKVFSSAYQYIDGQIDQPRIHSRALTGKEVMEYAINPWQVYEQ